MTNHIETLKALIDAGDKAMQGDWEFWNACSWNRFGTKGQSKPFIYPYINSNDGHEELAITQRDSTFITQAANSREALKALVEEVERLRKLTNSFVDECESEMFDAEHRKKVASADYHDSEVNHQEGRWHCANDLRKWAEKKGIS